MESNLTKINQLNCKTDRIRYNLDHLYCHTTDNNYISASSNSELIGILKENKQLKSMLLLHLDLIQEQSEQLLTKEKDIATLREENNLLRKNIEIINQNIQQTKEEQNKEISDQFDSDDNDSTSDDNQKLEEEEINENNLKETINHSENIFKINSKQFDEIHGNHNSIIGERNGQFINKIILQRVIPTTTITTASVASTTTNITTTEKQQVIISTTEKQQTSITGPEIKLINNFVTNNDDIFIDNDNLSTKTTTTTNLLTKQSIINTNLAAPVNKDDVYTFSDIYDENSCENIKKSYKYLSDDHHNINNHHQLIDNNYVVADNNKIMNNKKRNINECKNNLESESNLIKRQYIKGSIMTTNKVYLTRGWQSEEIDNELIKQANDIALEIPSWSIKECTGCYSIEGTEDLSDETIIKRHSKLEIDERRRKKWDVQRIREQRTIERLKRRHCKTELLENETKKKVSNISSFYPPINSIKFIEITEEIPVQAFGENIPLLNSLEFSLPWLSSTIRKTNISFSVNSRIELVKFKNNRQKFSDLPINNRLQKVNSLKS